jgi:regulator of replication initiation timing
MTEDRFVTGNVAFYHRHIEQLERQIDLLERQAALMATEIAELRDRNRLLAADNDRLRDELAFDVMTWNRIKGWFR